MRFATCALLLASVTGCLSECPDNAGADTLSCSSSLKAVKAIKADAELDPYPEYNEQIEQADSVAIARRISNNEKADNEDNPLLKHHYSKRQAWNADETIIDLGGQLLSMDGFEPAYPHQPMGSERNWSNLSPTKIFGIRFNPTPIEFVSFDIATEKYTIINIFSAYDKCTMGQGEGNVTADDRFVALTCKKEDSESFDVITFDIENRQIIATMTAKPNLNWAGFSPSGNYILLENNTHPDPNAELIRYSPELTDELVLTNDPEHGDFGYDTDGNEVYVMMEDTSMNYIRLDDRLKVNLPIGSRSNYVGYGHVSCRNTQRPGWCYISAHANKHLGAVRISASTPVTEKLYDLDMKAKKAATIYEHWGYHQSSEIDYASQPKATVSRTGRHLLFTSNWLESSPTNEYILSVDSTDKLITISDK